jgi:hypothetical protein
MSYPGSSRRKEQPVSDEDQIGGFPHIDTWRAPGAPDPGGGRAYGPMIEALRDFLDKVAAAKPDEATLDALAGDLRSWSRTLAPLAVGEAEQVFAHRLDLPGRGQTMAPAFVFVDADATSVRGTVTYGRYFLGGGGAAHGGAIPLLFDEVMGRLANSGQRPRAHGLSAYGFPRDHPPRRDARRQRLVRQRGGAQAADQGRDPPRRHPVRRGGRPVRRAAAGPALRPAAS